MTACVNKKHTRRVALAISASLVGALTLGAAAPAVAFAAEGAEALLSPSDVWDGIEFSWSVEADRFGDYTVQAGDQFMLTSATDAFSNPVSMSDLTVVYSNGATLSASTPDTPGDYTAYVVNSRIDIPSYNAANFEAQLTTNGIKFKKQVFKVVAKSLEGAFAYQNDNAADTSFKFTGNPITVNFADADGNKLVAGEDYTVDGLGTVQGAGDYTVTLKGMDDYSGTVTVKFTVDPIDLENDVFTIAPVESTHGSGALFSGGNLIDTTKIMVNGEPLATGVVDAKIVTGIRVDGSTIDGTYRGNDLAKVTLEILANSSQTPFRNIVDLGATGEAELLVVNQIVSNFYYDGESIPTGGLKFETAKGEAFDPSLISAALVSGGNNLPVDVTVTKDGEVVTDYTTPGVYKVTVDVAVPSDLEYAGSMTFDVTVISRRYSEQPKAFVAVDGKDVANPVEYDGKTVEPVVAVKAGSTTLEEGTDYTVTYKDADGNVVESIIEPGEYYGTVDFGEAVIFNNGVTGKVDDIDFTVTVTKAQLRSAKADQDVYAYVEDQAVAPTFTAYNEEDLDGLSLAIDPAVTGVTYYECDLNSLGKPYTNASGDYVTVGGSLKASDLTEEGWYVADVTAPADDPHFTGTVTSEPFQISTYAAFGDVDAGSWYAQGVYNAAKLGYMNGVKGTDLFMPLADISRAELAKVFSNMAGRPDKEIYTPTQFGDVDAWAWYAEPIAWASEAGVVTGYQDGSGNFGPNDKATREQVALMLYRYAQAQGQDVSVEDADAALAAYSDGSEVSGWAKEAMAWAVENGVFGVDTDELMPQDNIQRAQVALIAVRYQPERLPEA